MTPPGESDVRRIPSLRKDASSPKAKYLHVRHLDELEGRTTPARAARVTASGIIGLFADVADEIDEIVQLAYHERSSSRWERLTNEDLT